MFYMLCLVYEAKLFENYRNMKLNEAEPRRKGKVQSCDRKRDTRSPRATSALSQALAVLIFVQIFFHLIESYNIQTARTRTP